MDAEREAREVLSSVTKDWSFEIHIGCPDLMAEIESAIAAALRRAHAAGRREAVEECARVVRSIPAQGSMVRGEALEQALGRIRALAAELKADATLRAVLEPLGYEVERAGEQKEGEGWLPMASAPRRKPVLLLFKNPIPTERDDAHRFDGLQLVGRLGSDIEGWCFAAPVGMGGFPDEWFVGWQPLPPPPRAAGEGGNG